MGILTQLLTSGEDIRTILITLCFYIPCILISLVCHEYAHAFVAYCCGDDTARRAGRLSLNPADHLTLSGTLCMLLIGFGWAKPVPVNASRMKHRRRDLILVSLAGVAVNFVFFILSCALSVLLISRILPPFLSSAFGTEFFACSSENGFGVLYYGDIDSLIVLIDNQLSGMLFRPDTALRIPWLQYVIRFLMVFQLMNISLFIFNFLPVPPLDGFNFWNLTIFNGKLRISGKAMSIILIVFYALLLFGDRLFGFDPFSRAVMGTQSFFARLFISLFGV